MRSQILSAHRIPLVLPVFWAVLILSAPASSFAALTKGEFVKALPQRLVEVKVQPERVELKRKFEYAQVLVLGKLNSGELVDLTSLAEVHGADGVVEVSGHGVLRGKKDGTATLSYSFGGKHAAVAVSVQGQQAPLHPSFTQDVMPLLGKLGCNAGTCHGNKDGQNGFKLSLRGYDAEFDHRALTDDVAGRRFNRAAPDQSLMLLKTSGVVPHVGGVRTSLGEPYYEILRAWIADGAKLDSGAARVTAIEVFPRKPTLQLAEMTQQMRVVATYSDGSQRDVTGEAFLESSDSEVIKMDEHGRVVAIRRGEAAALARYEGAYAATPVYVMGDREGFTWKDEPAHNYVDELAYNKMRQVKVLPSELCTDAQFLRRVYLDLAGLPPSAKDVRVFLADQRDSRTKRDEVIDRLVGSPEFVDHWTNKWADMLLSNRKFLGPEGAKALRGWIRGRVEANTPYDKFAYEVLTASGSTMENPAAAYFKVLREPDEVMENTTQLFLAVRFSCNKCHDHPFERWTQNQHWQMAAYFAQIGRQEDPKYKGKKVGGTAVMQATPLVEIISDSGSGQVKHPNTGQVVPPRFPYSHDDSAAEKSTLREQFARWATSPKNEYFATSYVNRAWSYLLGVGFIEPVDDIRAGNPPTNPELLQRLTADFVEHRFDVHHLLKTICKSRTYQRSIVTNRWNETDRYNYARGLARRLPAEVIYDAVHRTTGSQSRLPGMPAGARAAEIPDSGIELPDDFLALFGRPARETSCECERSADLMLGSVMSMINGPTINGAIVDANNEIAKLVAREKDDAKVVEEIFLRLLNRPATPKEIELCVQAMQVDIMLDERKRRAEELAKYAAALDAKQTAWEMSIAAAPQTAPWTPLKMQSATSTAGATFAAGGDQSIRVEGNLAKDTYTVVFHTDLKDITGLRIEALSDDKLPAKGPGRAPNGNFVLSELNVAAASKADPAKSRPVALQNAAADFSQDGFGVAAAIDGNPGTGWAVSPQFGKNHVALFETKQNAGHDGGTVLTVTMKQEYQDGKHNLGRFRVSLTTSPRPVKLEGGGPPADLVALAKIPADQRTPQQQQQLTGIFRSQDAQYTRLKGESDRLNQLSGDPRLAGAQDLVWALVNSPAFLFNR